MGMGGQLEKGLNIDGGTDGTPIGNTGDSLHSHITNVVSVTPTDGQKATYSAAITGLTVAASATDVFTITGSASTIVKVLRISISAWASSVSNRDIQLIKRSTANTGGTSTTRSAVAHDSTNATASAVVRAYTANPTVGTEVGLVRAAKLSISNQTPGNAQSQAGFSVLVWDFSRPGQAITLRGTAEVLSVNLNANTIAGSNFNIDIEWTEE